MGLAYATSDIGAHHTRAWTIAKEMEEGQNWTNDEKVDTVIYHQKVRPLFDMLGVCRLPWIELGLSEKHYANFYKYVTGNETSLEELLGLSNETSLEELLGLSNYIYDLTRLINTRLGMSRKDDTLPYKVWANPPLTGPNAGKVIGREDFQKLLSLYYQKRGWDENGIPPAEVEKKFSD
jgi:aldehyde:ferredoxin oxidoreductase